MPAFTLRYLEPGSHSEPLEAENTAGAFAEGERRVRALANPGDTTWWTDFEVLDSDGGESLGTQEVVIHPREPTCLRGVDHVWQSPHALVGGLRENPGVFGSGGGVKVVEACMACGCERVTDTWATRPDNGEQGKTSVSYTPGRYTVESPVGR